MSCPPLRGLITLLPVILCTFGCEATPQDDLRTEMVRHVVVFKYSDDAGSAQIQRVTEAFAALPEKIPGILSFEYGTNNSPEGLDRDFTHVYLMTFEDAEARDSYLPHPDHVAFTDLLDELGILEDVFVVDYVPER